MAIHTYRLILVYYMNSRQFFGYFMTFITYLILFFTYVVYIIAALFVLSLSIMAWRALYLYNKNN